MALPTLTVAEDYKDMARMEILPGWRTASGDHVAGIKITLAPGWITYWRAPGEAGIPPQFDWSGSENLGEVGFHWPVPQIIVSNGVTTLGFEGEFILPIEVTAAGKFINKGKLCPIIFIYRL